MIQINAKMPAPGHAWFDTRTGTNHVRYLYGEGEKNFGISSLFSQKADETREEYYVKKMNEAAASLDELAKHFLTRCRCGDELNQRSDGPLGVWHRDRRGQNTPAQRSSSKRAATHH